MKVRKELKFRYGALLVIVLGLLLGTIMTWDTSRKIQIEEQTVYLDGRFFTSVEEQGELISLATLSFSIEDKIIGVGHAIEKEQQGKSVFLSDVTVKNGRLYVVSLKTQIGEIDSIGKGGVFITKSSAYQRGQKVETATKIHSGIAYFYSAITGEGQYYPIRILNCNEEVNGKSCISFQMLDCPITHNKVLPGMSGTPILQDGKLIGVILGMRELNPRIGFITPIDAILTDN